MRAFWFGVVTAIPLMLAIGPISTMLMVRGLTHGFGRTWPASVGVTLADLTGATVAWRAGGELTARLQPYLATGRLIAAGVLFGVAAILARRGVTGWRDARLGPEVADSTPTCDPGGRTGWRLGAAMWAATIVNPLSLVSYASITVLVGDAAGRAWVAGVGCASLVVHLCYVGAASMLRHRLDGSGVAVVQCLGAASVVVTAVSTLR